MARSAGSQHYLTPQLCSSCWTLSPHIDLGWANCWLRSLKAQVEPWDGCHERCHQRHIQVWKQRPLYFSSYTENAYTVATRLDISNEKVCVLLLTNHLGHLDSSISSVQLHQVIALFKDFFPALIFCASSFVWLCYISSIKIHYLVGSCIKTVNFASE